MEHIGPAAETNRYENLFQVIDAPLCCSRAAIRKSINLHPCQTLPTWANGLIGKTIPDSQTSVLQQPAVTAAQTWCQSISPPTAFGGARQTAWPFASGGPAAYDGGRWI